MKENKSNIVQSTERSNRQVFPYTNEQISNRKFILVPKSEHSTKWLNDLSQDQSRKKMKDITEYTTLKDNKPAYSPITVTKPHEFDTLQQSQKYSMTNFKRVIDSSAKTQHNCYSKAREPSSTSYSKLLDNNLKSPQTARNTQVLKQMNVSPIKNNNSNKESRQNSITDYFDLSIQQDQEGNMCTPATKQVTFQKILDPQSYITQQQTAKSNNLFYQYLENATLANFYTQNAMISSRQKQNKKQVTQHKSKQFSLEFNHMEKKLISRQISQEKYQLEKDRRRSATLLLNCIQNKIQQTHDKKDKNELKAEVTCRNNELRQKVIELIDKQREAESQIIQLQKEKIDIQNQCSQNSSKIVELSQQNSHLRSVNDKLSTQIEQYDEFVLNKRFNFNSLAKQLKQQIQNAEQLSKQINEKNEQLLNLTTKATKLEQENERYKVKNEELNQTIQQFQKLELHVTELEKVYHSSFFKLSPLIANQICTLNSTNDLMQTLDHVVSRIISGKELPIQLLVAHRRTQKKTEKEIDQELYQSTDFTQIRELMQEVSIQTRLMYEKIKGLLDSLAEHCIHDLTKALVQTNQ